MTQPFGVLEISVWDERSHLINRDELIGIVQVPLTSLVDQKLVRPFFTLRSKYSKTQPGKSLIPQFNVANISGPGTKVGEIQLTIQYKYKESERLVYQPWLSLKENNYQSAIRFFKKKN